MGKEEHVETMVQEGRESALGENGLIALLDGIQDKYGYLSEEHLRSVARQTGRSLVDIYGIATFYRSFSLQPRGEHTVFVCLGTACHVRGAPMIVEEFERQLGIHVGETTPDGMFTLETVNCLGACALGPIVAVDGRFHAKVTTAKVARILEQVKSSAGERARGGLQQLVDAAVDMMPVEAATV